MWKNTFGKYFQIAIKLKAGSYDKKTGKMVVDQKAEDRAIRKGLGTTGFPTIETQDSVLTIKDTDNNLTFNKG